MRRVRLSTVSDQSSFEPASRVILSVSPPGERTAEALDTPSYRSYLRRTRAGPVTVGDEWEEFVSSGCGTTRDVTLRVLSAEGGEAIDEETELVFEPSDE